MKFFKKTTALICSCLTMINCNFCETRGNNELTSQESLKQSLYHDLATKFSLPVDEVENKLSCNFEGKNYKIIPFIDSPEYLEHYKKIYVYDDPDYIKYQGHGNLMTEEEALQHFNEIVNETWNVDKPSYLSGVITVDDVFVGACYISFEDTYAYPEFSILKEFAGQGISSVSSILGFSFLIYLREKNIYNFEYIYATVHPDNRASIRLLEKAGFVTDNQIIQKFNAPRKVYKFYFTFMNLLNYILKQKYIIFIYIL